jgi:hypothetical protein
VDCMKRKPPRIVCRSAPLLFAIGMLALSAVLFSQTGSLQSGSKIDKGPAASDHLELGNVVRAELVEGQSHSMSSALKPVNTCTQS